MDNNTLKEDAEIIADIKAKYDFHVRYVTKYKKLLDAWGYEFEAKPAPTAIFQNIPPSNLATSGNAKQTMDELIFTILSLGNPMRTKELLEEYIRLAKPDVEPILKDFSSRIIGIANNAKKPVGFRNVELKRFKKPFNYWWGLNEWFDDRGSLMPEYQRKIDDKMKSSFPDAFVK